MIQHDNEAIASFIKFLGEDVHLCSIVPDGACHGRWFGDNIDAATIWAVRENSRGKGVYWTVNRVAEGYNKKPKKHHILAALT
jgi:hypothetical protein